MRTPAEAAIYAAERPIYAAHAKLIELLQINTSIARHASARLPLPEAERCMDGIDDDFANVRTKLAAAIQVMTAETERLQEAEEARYAAREDRAIDRDFHQWVQTVSPGITRKLVA